MTKSKRFISIILSLVLSVMLCNSVGAVDLFKSQVFTYTGSCETFTVPVGGIYKLEVWGALGGDLSKGGRGGYATGNITLTDGQQLFVYVGGKGGTDGTDESGGYNGGTDGGGGATDIRIGGTNLSNRVIVAGGGGFGSSNSAWFVFGQGGYGGGKTGGTGGVTYYTQWGASGGTQSSGGLSYSSTTSGGSGSLGVGGYGVDNYGGGGGGYYGGGGSGANIRANNYRYVSGGGGGSSYIGGVTSGNTIAGNSKMPTYDDLTEIGHSSDGVAKITLIQSFNPVLTITKSTDAITSGYVTVNVSASKDCTFKYSMDKSSVTSGTSFDQSFKAYNNGTYYIYALSTDGSSTIDSIDISNLTTKSVDMNGSVEEIGKSAIGTVPVLFNTNPTIFKAVVAVSLPVFVDEYGNVQTATNATITNESSYGCIEVDSVRIESKNDWILNKFDSVFKDFKVNSRNYGLAINGFDLFDEIVQVTDILNVGESKHLEYSVGMAPQAYGLSTQIVCDVVVTIGWYK